MTPEHKDIIKNSVKDIFSFQEKFSDFELSSNFQLMLSQLDLFKLLSSLVVAIIGIGYLFDSKLENQFLLLSLIFSLLTLVVSISFTREVIDLQPKLNAKAHQEISKTIQQHNDMALKALREDNSEIFFEYARNKLGDTYSEPSLNYIGEILIFMFYLSIAFLCFSFLALKFPFTILSWQTIVLLICVYLISFKNWAHWLSEKLSIEFFNKSNPSRTK